MSKLQLNTTEMQAILEMVQNLPSAGGGLPEGWATGTFNTTQDTIRGGFDIEHGLGAVPNVVIIYRETYPLMNGYIARGVIRFNVGAVSSGMFFYDQSATVISSSADDGVGLDTDATLRVPTGGSYMYVPVYTYRWIAIRLEG